MSPKLSIVIPAYNVEMYIGACLDSVVGQSLKDIEIIVVNDCSPDNSDAVILEYANRDSRIKYIRHENNLGAGGARNTGIKNSTAEWITFLDPDDYVALDCYEIMLRKIEEASADIGFFGTVYFDDKTKKPIMILDLLPGWQGGSVIANEKNINSINPTVTSKIYRLRHLLDNGIAFPEHLKHEDDEFLFKYFSAVEPVMVLDATPYYYYRRRESSTMSGVSSSRKDLPDIASNMYNFLLEKGISQKYRKAILDRIDYYCGSLNAIDRKYREDFIKKMNALLVIIAPSDAELSYMRTVTKALAKDGVFDQLVFLLEEVDVAMSNKWYKFGQLETKKKIGKAFSFLINVFRK